MIKHLFVLLLISCLARAQSGDLGFTLSKVQAEQDLETLFQSLQNIHPALYQFQSEEEFTKARNQMIASLEDSISELELHRRIREFIHQIGCGHTTALPSQSWYAEQKENSKIIPLTVFVNQGELFIRKAFDKDSLLYPGQKIKSIDGRPSKEIMADMLAIQEVDGISEAYSIHRIQRLFSTYHLFLYGRRDEYQITVVDSLGRESQLKLKAGLYGTPPRLRPEIAEADISMDGSSFYLLDEYEGWALIDHNSFSSSGYKKYYRKVFKRIEEEQINHLVLDLRANGGGYFPNGMRLLRYLLADEFQFTFNRPAGKVHKSDQLKMPFSSRMTRFAFGLMPDRDKEDPRRNYELNFKPKKRRYTGKLYVITDGGTFSMGSYVAAMLKHHRESTFIGSETGGGESGSNAVLMYTLSLANSGIRVLIPYYHLDHQVETQVAGHGVAVDIPIHYKVEDWLLQRDLELDYLLTNFSGHETSRTD